jgi:cation diffusion facilitator family transporter
MTEHWSTGHRGDLSEDPAEPDDHDHDHGVHHHHEGGGLRGVVASVVGQSHDPGDAIDDAMTADARGIRAVKVSLLVLAATATVQLAIVALSGSVALLADTIHNFSDALTAVPLWIAFALGGRAATRRYTFGYRRAEDLAGLFVLLMIAGSAVLAAWQSVNRLLNPQPIANVPIVAIAGIVGFAGNEAVALFRIRTGRTIGSAALVADGYHARTDGLTSLAVVAGALGVAAGYPLADPLVGLFISAVILVVLRQATAQMLGRLMDAVDPPLVDQVEGVAAGVPGVQAIDRAQIRWLGHGLEVYLTLTVDRDLTVAAGHDLAEEVRHRLLHEIPRLDVAFIHVNPCAHDGTDAHALTRHHGSRQPSARTATGTRHGQSGHAQGSAKATVESPSAPRTQHRPATRVRRR